MTINLEHPFLYQCQDLDFLLNTTKLSVFIKRLVKLGGSQDPDFYDPLKYMGDGWEFFTEFLLKFLDGDHTYTYTYDYHPNLGEDNGIDGFGLSTIDGTPSTIQAKFCADPKTLLTNKHNIGNHPTASLAVDGFTPNGKNLICVTSGDGVHYNHAYYQVATVLNRKTIGRRVNGNIAFWTKFRESVANSLYRA